MVDHYHLTLDQIANLTDRSLVTIYFHPREKNGAIKIPVPAIVAQDVPETEDKLLSDLTFLREIGLISEENYQQCVEDAKRKNRGSEGQER